MYKDSVFLVFEGDLMDRRTIWDNVAIYLKALLRLERHLKIENNRFQTNGAYLFDITHRNDTAHDGE